MVTTFAKVLGFFFLLIGILGFVPAATPDHMLFGIFMTDTPHNIVHLLSGVILLAVGFSENWELTRRVVLLFAAVYGLVTVLGFFTPDGGTVMGLHMNMADDVLHLAITVTALMFALPQQYPSMR